MTLISTAFDEEVAINIHRMPTVEFEELAKLHGCEIQTLGKSGTRCFDLWIGKVEFNIFEGDKP